MRRYIWPQARGTRRQRKLWLASQLRMMRTEMIALEPSADELATLTQMGRMFRMVASGTDPLAAAEQQAAPESADEYVKRNEAAMAALQERMLSPEYMARFAELQNITNPVDYYRASTELKRENFSAIDMEAVHRTISARNRQWRSEGILPPEKPTPG